MPLTNKGDKKLKNSFEAKQFLQNQTIPHDYELASFDVKNLFTCFPHDFILENVDYAISNDNDL